MSDCSKIKDLLVLYCESALEATPAAEVRDHLATCPGCSREAREIEEVLRRLSDPLLFAPNPDYAWQLQPATLAARARTTRSVKSWLPWNSGSLAWTLSMAATVILALGSIWLANRPIPAPEAVPIAIAAAPGNEAFLHKMQAAFAREATAQYLSECQDLLLTLMRSGRKCRGENYDVAFEVERAQQLLQRKQLLDSELTSPDVARAKSLCDELETFLVNLSTSTACESPDGMRRMESYIQKQQLLLRINLLQSELS